MFIKVNNFIISLIFGCSTLWASDSDFNIGQLKSIHAAHTADIKRFLDGASDICNSVLDRNVYASKSQIESLLSSIINLFDSTPALKSSIGSPSKRRVRKNFTDDFCEISRKIDNEASENLLFLSLDDSDLFDEELWDIAKFQVMHRFLIHWSKDSIAYFIENSTGGYRVRLDGFNCRPINDPCVLSSILIKDLFDITMGDEKMGDEKVEQLDISDIVEQMNIRINALRERKDEFLRTSSDHYTLF